MTAEEHDAWFDALWDLAEDLGWGERILLGGHPYLIQGEMSRQCEIVARGGVSTGHPLASPDPRIAEWTVGAREWVHVLQVGSAEGAGLMWGDMGCLYFWMRKDDIAERRFDAAWMILQCT